MYEIPMIIRHRILSRVILQHIRGGIIIWIVSSLEVTLIGVLFRVVKPQSAEFNPDHCKWEITHIGPY